MTFLTDHGDPGEGRNLTNHVRLLHSWQSECWEADRRASDYSCELYCFHFQREPESHAVTVDAPRHFIACSQVLPDFAEVAMFIAFPIKVLQQIRFWSLVAAMCLMLHLF